jgi:hypothetical protein
MNNNTPPSPTTSLLQPLSPYTLFDVPFSELKLSAPSSPETNQPHHGHFDDTENNSATCNNNSDNNNTCNTTAAPETESNIENKDAQEQPTVEVTTAPGQAQQIRDRTSCKRTLSRARSHRKPSVHRTSAPKKNRSQPQPEDKANDAPLDHGKVMEALRAKLQRSTEQQKELLLNPKKEEFNSMSPTGILLLDLKNPKKTFPVRPKATPRTSLVRKPSSFISAHRVKEPSV